MPLVNALQISQDLGSVPTPPPVQLDMFKMAGATNALADLGLITSNDELEKLGWAPLVAGLARALPWIARGGRALWGLGSKLWGAGGKAIELGAKPIGALGRGITQRVGTRLGASPEMIGKIQGLGKGMAREGVGFGLFGGGLEAAMAEPGERGQAFMRGFGSGMLGGMAFRGASNLATAGMRRMMPQAFPKLETMAKPGFFGKLGPGESRLKSMGAKMLVGGVPFAAGMGASMFTPTFHGQPQSSYQQYAPYAARLGAGVTMPHVMGAYPGGYGYNPNLPLPQSGY